MRRNPLLFVVGCPRSGTTLLQRMLNAHPELCVANDTHFIPRALTAPEELRDPPLTPDLVERVRAYHRFPRLGVSKEGVARAAERARTYGEFVSALYDELARQEQKPHAGEKTPDYVRRLPLLHALFPDALLVHIIRDGREVALSARGWAHESKGPGRYALWSEDPVGVAALWWKWQVGSGRAHAAALGPSRYHEVRFDALNEEPEHVLRGVCDFLGLPFAHAMLAFNEGHEREVNGRNPKKAWLPPTPGLRDVTKELAPEDLAVFEAIAGDLLDELGYARLARATGGAVRDRAARCVAWWSKEEARARAAAGA